MSMIILPPYSLGFPGESTISNYYLGEPISKEEITRVNKTLADAYIEPENTRIRKSHANERWFFEVLQASVERESTTIRDALSEEFSLVRGDHSVELMKICHQ